MADVGLRDLGSIVPGRKIEPEVAASPVIVPLPSRRVEPDAVLVTPPPKPRPRFGGDLPAGADALGIDTTLTALAELATHERAATPMVIGLLGAPGTGKSFAMARLADRIRALAAAAAGTKASPFAPRVHLQAVDAASLDGDPALGLAGRLHAGLRQVYPDLARELGHAARDPHVVLREVNEKLDEARRRLDAERRALDDAGSRRAGLVETVLYEAAGSEVDAYARANRTSIAQRLLRFGIGGEPVRAYKELVQHVSGSGKAAFALRALFAYKGQSRLIVTAVVLAALAVGLGFAIGTQDIWLADLRAGPKAGAALADWLEAHAGLFDLARNGLFALAAFVILLNLWRAFAFVGPIVKGARLLDGDLDARRRDLDGLYAHQTKRVDMLDADVERLTRESAEAERRVGYTGPAMLNEPSPFEAADATGPRFFATLARLMAEGTAPAPRRIVLALDHLDAVPPARTAAILDALHRIAGEGLVGLVALDPLRLDAQARADLARWLQVPVQVAGDATQGYASLVDAVLGRPASSANEAAPQAATSRLDEPVDDREAILLSNLAELAGPAPRSIKRMVNLYRLARLDDGGHRGALALMLALAGGGSPAERTAVTEALGGLAAGTTFEVPTASRRLRDALDVAFAYGGAFDAGTARRAARRASIFALEPLDGSEARTERSR